MINTFYSLDALGTSQAFFLALLIGFGFGFALERAGFSSSRRLAGVFYFTDMAVVKVMFYRAHHRHAGALVSGGVRLDRARSDLPHAHHLWRPDRGRPAVRRRICHGWLVSRHSGGRSRRRPDRRNRVPGWRHRRKHPVQRTLPHDPFAVHGWGSGRADGLYHRGHVAQRVHPRVHAGGRGCLLAGGVGRRRRARAGRHIWVRHSSRHSAWRSWCWRAACSY